MKKVLFIAAKANMIQQFNIRNILMTQSLGMEVHVASDFIDYGSMDEDETNKLLNWLDEIGAVIHQIPFERGIGSIKGNRASAKALKQVFNDGPSSDWAFVHCHSPLGGIIGRYVAHKFKVPALYTAHGFQFFSGGPKKNWVFYPVEKAFSYWTNELITINHRDYRLAKKNFKKPTVDYIAGVGIDVAGALAVPAAQKQAVRAEIRTELGLSDSDYVLTTIGELNDNKNQIVVLEAMAKLDNPQLRLLIAGVGPNLAMLEAKVAELGLESQVQFLGYRSDITNIHYAADLNVFPSLREGLGLGGLESLVDGNYVIGSQNTGMADYLTSEDLGLLVDVTDVDAIAQAIEQVYRNQRKPDLEKHRAELMHFDASSVDAAMLEIYKKYV
ncbi:glycosyltransferase [Weissella viridescens]|uniref:glycosyltransferase n=1 Tax=Weissella viridescens TaxID=1629 RepID=UPI003AA7D784